MQRRVTLLIITMANWGVVLARRPIVPRTKKARQAQQQFKETPSPSNLELMSTESVYMRHGHIFKHLCQPEEGEHDCFKSGCERITINVSGLQFVTRRSILEAHPTTVLGDPEKRRPYYDSVKEEYFFDRHRLTFESIFNYYMYGGKLKRPPSVSDDVFLDECKFFQVEENVIKEYKKDEGYTETIYKYPANPFLAKVWGVFEYPETSRLAFFVGLVSVVATLISIVTFTLETLPQFHPNCTKSSNTGLPYYYNNSTRPSTLTVSTTTTVAATSAITELDGNVTSADNEQTDFKNIFFTIETICNIWFTFEAIVRYIACPNKLLFWKDIKNIIDIMAIVPYYVSLVEMMSPESKCEAGNDLAFLRVIRLIRVFKLTKHSQGLQILLLTFQSSIEGLTLFVLTLMVCILVFSSMIYYCEIGEENTQIKSIPGGFWWAVITMCTVGYGDVVPVGQYGRIVGAICALSGVLTLAIPVPIITENFNKFYVHKQRSKARESSEAGLVGKVHQQLVKMAVCCKQQANCKRGTDSQPPSSC